MASARLFLALTAAVTCTALGCHGSTRSTHHVIEQRDGRVVLDRKVETETEYKGAVYGYAYPGYYYPRPLYYARGYYGPQALYDNRRRWHGYRRRCWR